MRVAGPPIIESMDGIAFSGRVEEIAPHFIDRIKHLMLLKGGVRPKHAWRPVSGATRGDTTLHNLTPPS